MPEMNVSLNECEREKLEQIHEAQRDDKRQHRKVIFYDNFTKDTTQIEELYIYIIIIMYYQLEMK